ncbi:hypothetical protein FB567DRAFT_586499 [Paraphoma chrysanthemicola]|uniref:Uncharacterized protein n=1 Tax=Paraphoma chrysanthemicola TaxID=798071 RepID=A0A8K0W5G1_9PLEO|nr:hypothetical protein FB567DRAFT_586499 [Paraphoma chrysanthemicola]
MSIDMNNIQRGIRDVNFTDIDTTERTLSSPLETEEQVKARTFESLKITALANCRLLYGSERMKFYDIVLGMDEDEKTFCVALVCSREGESKILRTMASDCPLKAIRGMVVRLQKDCFPLLMQFGAGVQTRGQLGYTNELTGKWIFEGSDNSYKPDGAVDDTHSLPAPGPPGPRRRGFDSYTPRGTPRDTRHGPKRAREDVNRMDHEDNPNDLQYGEP